jgi:hypothetical protein
MYIARSNPTDLTGTAKYFEIQLKWNAPYIPGKKYNIYLKRPWDDEFEKVTEVSGTSYTLSKLKSDTAYRIYITSVDAAGTESLPSEQIELTTLNQQPNAPDKLIRQTIEDKDPAKSGVLLSWNQSNDPDGQVVEYRIFKKPSGGELLKLGIAKKTEFFIADTDMADADYIMVKAVDNNGVESDESISRDKTIFGGNEICIRIKPLFVYPFGTMGKVYGAGVGTGFGLFANNYLFKHSQFGIETGYIYWSGKRDTIKRMDMIPLQLSVGYHFIATSMLSITPSIGAGYVFMSTSYTDAAFQKKSKTGYEPLFTASLSAEYLLTPRLYIFAGGDYNAIYETSGLKSFASAHIGAGYQLF